MELGYAVVFCNDGLADLNEEHFDLNRRPSQSVMKWPPSEPNKPPHDGISQNVAALLETPQLGPWAVGALEIYLADALEASSSKLVLDVEDGVQIRAEGGHTVSKIT